MSGLIFFDLQFSRCAVCDVCTCIKNGTFNHCGKVKGLEQYTSWKVRVPDSVFSRNVQKLHRHVNEYAYVYVIANATHMLSVSFVCVSLHLRPTVIFTVGACSPRTVKSGETLVDAGGGTDVQIVR